MIQNGFSFKQDQKMESYNLGPIGLLYGCPIPESIEDVDFFQPLPADMG